VRSGRLRAARQRIARNRALERPAGAGNRPPGDPSMEAHPMSTAHKATLVEAYERLAARDAGGGVSDHELESERERLLADSESPQVAERLRYEHLYQSAELSGGYRAWALLALVVLAGVGTLLALLAWWLGGFPG
jgi:hypothetical protein